MVDLTDLSSSHCHPKISELSSSHSIAYQSASPVFHIDFTTPSYVPNNILTYTFNTTVTGLEPKHTFILIPTLISTNYTLHRLGFNRWHKIIRNTPISQLQIKPYTWAYKEHHIPKATYNCCTLWKLYSPVYKLTIASYRNQIRQKLTQLGLRM